MDLHFFDDLGTHFIEVVSKLHSKAKVSLFTNHTQDMVQLIAYELKTSELDALEIGIPVDHVLFDRTYDIAGAKARGARALTRELHEIKVDIESSLLSPTYS